MVRPMRNCRRVHSVAAMTSTTQRIDTLIIGAGQAGLSAAYHLQRSGRACLVIDAHERVGDNWRRHWDSLRLYSPARNDGLPGMPFPAPRWSYPTKDDVADYLETYAETFELPVRGGVRVGSLSADDGGYRVEHDDGTFEASNVIVATGTFGLTPHLPALADDLDPRIVQLHSSEYKNPDQLQPGPVLVVGASHSGGDIAYELAAQHQVILSGRDTGQIPFKLDKKSVRFAWPIVFFLFGHVLTRRTPMGRTEMNNIRHHGGPLLRVKRADLATAGVERVLERTTDVAGGLPMLGDGRVLDVTNVIWCTGFVHRLDWIKLPIVGDDGWPVERRGVVESAPGLYFTGLSFQSSMRSMLIGGAGADAAYVVNHIVRHRPAPPEPAESASLIDHSVSGVLMTDGRSTL
jgi:putative flavoprotein involved in K+ transport